MGGNQGAAEVCLKQTLDNSFYALSTASIRPNVDRPQLSIGMLLLVYLQTECGKCPQSSANTHMLREYANFLETPLLHCRMRNTLSLSKAPGTKGAPWLPIPLAHYCNATCA